MRVSIIIPTLNRCDQLNRTLLSLINLKTPSNLFEIIIVDNGSTDSTAFIVKKYQDENSNIDIRYFYDSNPGLLTGRHLGAKESKFDILTFIDDDVHVSSTWLDTIIEVMENKKDIVFLTGPNLPLYESYPPVWLSYFWSKKYNLKKMGWLSLLDFGNNVLEISPDNVWGLNFTIRKNKFEELGGFNPDCITNQYKQFQGNGESALTQKGIHSGYKALYHPGAMLFHEVPTDRMTEAYFCKRAYFQGIADSFAQLRKKNFEQESNVHVPPKQKNKWKGQLVYFFPSLYKIYHTSKQFITNKGSNSTKKPYNKEFEEILQLTKKHHQLGYDFHQNAFKSSDIVKKWVLKSNYFNYKIPNQ